MADTELEMDIEPLTPAPVAESPKSSPTSAAKDNSKGSGSSGGGDKTSRTVTRVQPGFMTPEGAGARVSRSIGLPSLWNLSPFLILDYCDIEPGQGFPDHPHRGMATVTMVLDGQVTHEDHLGHAGTLGAGDLQWMIAGRGLVHSEMPVGSARALQLWIDLPAARKMMKPRYVDRRAAQIPSVALTSASGDEVGEARVIAGELGETKGSVRETVNEILLLDVTLKGETWIDVPSTWTTFVYATEGTVSVAGKQVKPQECAVLSTAEGETGVQLQATGKGARVLLAASPPLAQELVMQGPFAVTSRDAAGKALADFRDGRNGFEKALGWRSKSGQTVSTGGGGGKGGGKGGKGKGKKGKKGRRGDDSDDD